VFDGIAAACFGIMVPLIVSDVAGGSGHFNLSLGAVGFGIGIGGTLSTPAAGWIADHFGTRMAFFTLMGIGIAAVLGAFIMPETRPTKEAGEDAGGEPSGGAPASPDTNTSGEPDAGASAEDARKSGADEHEPVSAPQPSTRRRA
jgi:MFS family permease